jgi:S1-C subfamily serine protease
MGFGRLAGYVTVFVLGFATCGLLLRLATAPASGATASAATRDDLLRSLASPPPGRRAAATLGGLPSVADAAAKVEPAVVNIDVAGVRPVQRGPLALLRPGGEEEFEGSGSGILLSADGYVVTNNHVVAPVVARGSNGAEITIRLDNGREFHKVSIIGRDPQTDLAVLKIGGAKGLPAAELGDSDVLRVGDWAVAVGNPLGFNSTVTLGIVSALNRRNFRTDSDALDRVIQTDAAINPGNSGGALADIDGRVVGINTAIASSTGASVGIGFAIPINAARRVIDQLVKQGKVVRPYLGVVYTPLGSVQRAGLPTGVRLPENDQGALVYNDRSRGEAIVPGSPAAKAGLRPFDVIRAVDGKPITEARTVKDLVQAHNVGDRLALTIWRNGQTFDVVVPLEAMPENFSQLRPNRFVEDPTLPEDSPGSGAETP